MLIVGPPTPAPPEAEIPANIPVSVVVASDTASVDSPSGMMDVDSPNDSMDVDPPDPGTGRLTLEAPSEPKKKKTAKKNHRQANNRSMAKKGFFLYSYVEGNDPKVLRNNNSFGEVFVLRSQVTRIPQSWD